MAEIKEYNANKSIYVPSEDLWERIKEKANRPDINRSISNITIRLWEIWLDGGVTPYSEDGELNV